MKDLENYGIFEKCDPKFVMTMWQSTKLKGYKLYPSSVFLDTALFIPFCFCVFLQGMYTLMARCEELDRSMQPIHTLAAQIRDIKRTLDALEAICK